MIRIWFDKGSSHSSYIFIIGVFNDLEKANECYRLLKELDNVIWNYDRFESFLKKLPDNVKECICKEYNVDFKDMYLVIETLREDYPFEECASGMSKYANVIVVWGYSHMEDETLFGTFMKCFGARVRTVHEDDLAKYIHELITKNIYEVEEVENEEI